MGTTLTGTTPATTYDSLIKVTDNGPIGTSLKTLTDGLGNDSALALSSRGLKVNQSATLITDTASLCHFSNNYLYLRGGSAGLSIGDDAFSNSITLVDAGSIVFEAGSAERMRITSAGNVGIGNSIPSSFLSNGNQLVVGSGAAAQGITIYSNTAGTGNLFFADGTAGDAAYRGFLRYDHALDAMLIYTAGANERMIVTSAGNVGIGTSSPAAKLNVVDANGIGVRVGDISAAPNTQTAVYVGVSTSALTGGNGDLVLIPRTSDARDIVFYAGLGTPTLKTKITNDGYIRMAASTGGIQFNGDTAAANALDDYEEGTFTPTIEGTSTAGTGTYTTQFGQYTKIGNMIYFRLFVAWTAHTGTGDLQLGGLPFTANATRTAPCSSWVSQIAYTTVPNFTVSNGTTKITALEQVNDNFSTGLPMDASGNITISGTYHA